MRNLILLGQRCLHLTLILAFIGIVPVSAAAWSRTAHLIIAGLAWKKLTPEGKEKIAKLLAKPSSQDLLSPIALWADEAKLEQRKWHFVDIPLSASSYLQSRDCPKYDCLIEKINYYKNELGPEKSKQKRVEALQYLVHLMGDLHQPLHCTDNNDAAGNRVQVTFFGKTTNLHKLWDSDMIDRTGLSVSSYIDKLFLLRVSKRDWISNWAEESHEIARKYAYDLPRDRQLSNSYFRTNLPILENQLAKAAIRLVYVLEIALKVSDVPKAARTGRRASRIIS